VVAVRACAGRGGRREWGCRIAPFRVVGLQFAKERESMRKTLLFLCITFMCVSAMFASRQKAEVVSGRIIAYSSGMGCLNGNGYYSIVIRIETRQNTPSKFVKVEFSLPCNKSAESVLTNSSIQKFHLFRQRNCDDVLKERMDIKMEEKNDDKSTKNTAIPIWTYLSGNEQFTLPFGQDLPCYYSAELPLIPVL